ncbi:hypothetical protein [Natronorubrum halophilum]|nr:hypothetical protein [Natronorubrum halophilum]
MSDVQKKIDKRSYELNTLDDGTVQSDIVEVNEVVVRDASNCRTLEEFHE